MKEDVLEQVVEDYLQSLGYFTRHNLRFSPRKDHPEYVSQQDSVASDVDVVGLNPHLEGPERVWVVSCKSWQTGFDPRAKLAELRGEKKNPKRETWKHFREVWSPKWSEAFRSAVMTATGAETFRYSIAAARIKAADPVEAATAWSTDPTIATHLPGCELTFLDMRTMWSHIEDTVTKTPAPSEIGRLAQLLKAADIRA